MDVHAEEDDDNHENEYEDDDFKEGKYLEDDTEELAQEQFVQRQVDNVSEHIDDLSIFNTHLVDTNDNSEVQFNFRISNQNEKGIGPANEKEAEQFLATNPYLGDLMKRMIKEGVQEEVSRYSLPLPPKEGLPDKGVGKGRLGGDNLERSKVYQAVNKSPSNNTIYAPALNKVIPDSAGNTTEQVMDKISNFVEGIRLETQHRLTPVRASPVKSSPEPGTSKMTRPNRIVVNREQSERPELDDPASKIVLDADQFKSTIEPPPKGMVISDNRIDLVKQVFSDDSNDDEYFHLTCHVDKSLKSKIELGEYIELERLLPKRKSVAASDSSRL